MRKFSAIIGHVTRTMVFVLGGSAIIASFIGGWIGVRLATCDTLYCSGAAGMSGTATVISTAAVLGAIGSTLIWRAMFHRIEWGNALVFPAGLTLSLALLVV